MRQYSLLIILVLSVFIRCSSDNITDPVPDTVTDIDGNIYNTIKIGGQWWLAENLKATRYRNGDPIPNVTRGSEWADLSTGACCAYDNNESNADIYGLLYNWYAVDDSRNIAPEGWHVPTDEEWEELVSYLGGETVAGGKLKEAGYDHWMNPNTGATDEYEFTALPGGIRYVQPTDTGFLKIGDNAWLWSSTEDGSDDAWSRSLYHLYSTVGRGDYNRHYGFSVRCIRDN
ncbi:fibrobacter succinogenes major paralogous domain-containing protein [candidate division KSB1 bacterium]